MKKIHLVLTALLFAGGLMAQTTPPLGIIEKTPELKAFTNARIHVSAENVIDSATLVIDRGKIVGVGQNVDIPAGATVTDLAGKTIYPGFVESFTQYGLNAIPDPPRRQRHGQPPQYEAERIGGNSWNEANHAQENWVEMFQPDSDAAEEFMKQGFTTVQSAHLDGIFRGRSFVASLGAGLPNDLLIRPRSWHFMAFGKGRSTQEYPESEMGSIALIRQTMLDVDWYLKAHAAYRKNPIQELPEFNAAIEALAGLANQKIVFKTDNKLSLLRADRVAREFALDVTLVGSGREYERIIEIKSTGRTLILPVNYPETPEVGLFDSQFDISLGTLRHWDWAPSNPAIVEENGIRFALSTHGLDSKGDFLGNVRRAIERGLSKETALAALTTIPAEICGVADKVGTLEAGKFADFVVCDGDIFEEKTNIFAVYTHGQKKEFIGFDESNFAGYYASELLGEEVGLKLEDEGHGSKRSVSGKFRKGETSVKLDNVSFTGNKLQFSAALDSLGGEGVARFAMRKEGDRLSGPVAMADGSWQDYSAVVAEEPPEKEEEEEKESDSTEVEEGDQPSESEGEKEEDEEKPKEPDKPIARLTYPNHSFGREVLPQQQNVLVKNGTVWTSEDDGILENSDLLIKNGKIEAVGPNLSAPSDYLVIDATGKHVTTGVIDEHSHVAISHNVNEGTHSVTSEVRIGDVVNSDDVSIYRSLAGGTTVARLLHGSANPIGGLAQIIKYRWGAAPEALKLREAPPSIKFALGENVKQSHWGDQQTIRYPQTRMGVETLIRDAFQAAREYEADWKAYNALGKRQKERTVPPRKNLQLDPLVDVLNSDMFITCHSYVQSEILMLMRVADSFGFHVHTFTHILEGYKVADEMARHGAGAGSFSDWWAYKFEVYDAIPYSPGLMHEKGVVVSLNSDSRDLQRRLNQEAAKTIQYTNVSQEDAWKMVTINPAIQLKAEDHIGSLKAGKHADFVIWSGNPLSIYSHPEQTWVDGAKYFDLEEDLQMRQAIKEEKNRLVQKILTEGDEKKDKKPRGRPRRRPHDHDEPHQKGVSCESIH